MAFENLRAFLLYIVAIIFFFSPVVLGGKSLQPALLQPHGIVEGWPYGYEGRIPANTFNIDLATPAYYEWPINKLVGDMYRQGNLPLWNPYQGAGTPLLAQYSSRAFFPYQIIEDLSPVWTWDFFLLGRLLIAGFFTFLFLRLLGLPFAVSFLGGLFYMFSGTFIWFINLEQFVNNAMMLPVFAWCLELLYLRKGMTEVAVSGLSCAMVLLAGQPETALYLLFFAACYFVFRSLAHKGYRERIKDLARFSAVVIIGLMIASPMILPFIELMHNAHHIHHPGGNMGTRTPNGWELGIDILAPSAHELPQVQEAMPSVPMASVKGHDGFEFRPFPTNGIWDNLGGYTGVTPIFLALTGVLLSIRQQSLWKKKLLFFSSFGAAIVLKNFGVIPFLWLGALPLFDMAWSQRWAGPVWTFSLAAAGAFGFQTLTELTGAPFKGLLSELSDRFKRAFGRLDRWSLAASMAFHGLGMLAAQALAYNTFREWIRSSGGMHMHPELKASIKATYPWGVLVFISLYAVFYFTGGRKALLTPRKYSLMLLLQFIIMGLFSISSEAGVRVVQAISAPYFAIFLLTLYSLRSIPSVRSMQRLDEKGLSAPAYAFAAIFCVYVYLFILAFKGDVMKYFKIDSIRPFYIASGVVGSSATIIFLVISVIIALVWLRSRKGVLAFLPLAFLELWWGAPIGYDSRTMLLKGLPLLAGVTVVFCLLTDRKRAAIAALPLFLLSAMWLDSRAKNGLPDRYDPFTQAPYVKFLKEKGGQDRVIGTYGVLFPNFSSAVGLQDIRYINALSPKLTHEYREKHLQSEAHNEEASSSLWFTGRPEFYPSSEWTFTTRSVQDEFVDNIEHYSFLGVRYFVLPAGMTLNTATGGLDKNTGFPLIYDREVRIFENSRAMPRAFIVPPSGWGREGSSDLTVGEGPEAVSGKGTITDYSFDRVAIKASSNGDGLLVLTDLFYPGWVAYVNGKEAPIYRVNELVRGVKIGRGETIVEFRYHPRSFMYGAALSIAALFGIIVAIITGLVRDRRRAGNP